MIIRDIIAGLENDKKVLVDENKKLKDKIEVLEREKSRVENELDSLKKLLEVKDEQKTDETKKRKKSKVDNFEE